MNKFFKKWPGFILKHKAQLCRNSHFFIYFKSFHAGNC